MFTQYQASMLEIMFHMRGNFFNPGILMQIRDKTYAGCVVVNFCLDYQIKQSNLLRENIEKNRYSLRKARKVDTKLSPMWPRNSDEGGEDKQAQKQLSTSSLYLHLMKTETGN